MRNLLVVLVAVCIVSCQSSESVEDSVMQNPNSGEFGEAGADVKKSYDYKIELSTMEPTWFVSTAGRCHLDSLTLNFGKILDPTFMFVMESGQQPYGMPISQIRAEDNSDTVTFEVGLLIKDSILVPEGSTIYPMYTGYVLKLYYYGAYENIGKSSIVLEEYILDSDLIVNGEKWEEYKSDPATTEPDSVLTIVYQPIQ